MNKDYRSNAILISSLPGSKKRGLISTRDINEGEVLAIDTAILLQVLNGSYSVKLKRGIVGNDSKILTLQEIDTILESVAPFYSNIELITATTRSKVPDSNDEDAYSPPFGGKSSQWTRRALLADAALCQNSFSVRLKNSTLFEVPQCRAFFCFILYANHSCNPNAEANQAEECSLTSFEDDTPILYTLTAKRFITKGEEITISYLPTNWTRSKRQGNLSATYDFDCDCSRCKQEEEEESKDDSDEINGEDDKQNELLSNDESAEETRWKKLCTE